MTDQQETFWKNKIITMEMRIERLEQELARAQIVASNKSDFYTIDEYADIMKLCPATVYHKVKNGSIAAFKVGKCWRIPKNQIFE